MIIRKKRGFTLVEMLIVSGVLMIVSVIITQIVISSIRSSTKSESIREIKQNGDAAVNTMMRMIQNATSVNASYCAASPGGTGTSITITNPDGYQTIFQCTDDNGVSRIASVSAYNDIPVVPASVMMLTGGQTKLVRTDTKATGCAASPIQFTCILNGSNPGIITIQFGLAQKSASASYADQAFAKFSDSVVIRNQYAQ